MNITLTSHNRATLSLIASFILTTHFSFSQKWVEMMQDPKVNFYTVQKEFNNYYLKEKKKEKKQVTEDVSGEEAEENEVPGYTLYKRWEAETEPRVYPSGNRILPETAFRRDINSSENIQALGN